MENNSSTHLKRCKQCNQWSDGRNKFCEHCGFEHNKQQKEEIEARKLNGDLTVPVLKINEHDPLWLKIVKKPIQVVQLILYAVVGFLIYLSTSLAH